MEVVKISDRSSTEYRNGFSIHVDRDHRGKFRGNQAMDDRFRGWHYHIESEHHTQQELMEMLEQELSEMGAERISINTEYLCIGNVEAAPKDFSVWQLGDRSCVLWISSVTNSLHIEANKSEKYAKSILTKKKLVEIVDEWIKKQK